MDNIRTSNANQILKEEILNNDKTNFIKSRRSHSSISIIPRYFINNKNKKIKKKRI